MEKILGIVYAYDVKDGYQEILDLGFSWVRMEICFPWEDKMFGTLSPKYLKCKEEIRRHANHAFHAGNGRILL